jgi:hypothetical protein
MFRKLTIFYTVLLLFSQVAYCQYYETGQDPASLRWLQIKTDRFRVIYPESYGKWGAEFTRSLEDASAGLKSSFPGKKFRIPVIIHNYTTKSNGYVAWAPKRMEIYPSPEQNTIPLDPFKQLSIHELTHVLQMESLNQGFSKGVSFLFGEQTYGVVAFLLPLWFLEGDAVLEETALTESGRGRSPSFQKEMKAISVEKGKLYGYDQIVSGSFREYIPDHYQTGYQIVTWAVAKHNPKVWNEMLEYTAKYPFTINPVNLSLRNSTGLSKKLLYRETFDSLRTIWREDASKGTSYRQINPAKRDNYINYYCPVAAGRDSIIAVKTSLSRSPAFVLIRPSDGHEQTIHVPGQIYPYFISFGNSRLVWVETVSDPRWANREYSIIKLLDFRERSVRKITGRSRYLSAAISPDGNIIAAVENTTDNRNNLVFIDAISGSIIKSVPSPGNVYLQRPQWSDKGCRLTMISLGKAGEGIICYDTDNLGWTTLIAEDRNDLQASFLRNDSLFFVSSASGTDNLYVLTPEKKVRGITSSRFGVSDPFIAGDSVIFSDYTSLGNNICVTPARAIAAVPDSTAGAASFLINRIDTVPLPVFGPSETEYAPRPYRKWQHLLKFHSWMPFYADLEQIRSDPVSVRPGFTIHSQNNLSTLIASAGYEYSADKRHLMHTRITWQGWYPVIESQVDYGYNPDISKSDENVDDPSSVSPGFTFRNTVSVPLFFSGGRFYRYLRPSLTSEYFNDYKYIKENGSYDYGQNLISGRIYFTNYHRYAYRDIYPRWSQTVDINYTYAPFDRSIYGNEISFRSSFYFPGILPNNGIRLRFEKEKQNLQKYWLPSSISFPRGYSNIISSDIYFLSADYVTPLVLPDINLASLIYVKRLRAAFFYDFAQGTGNTYYEDTANGLEEITTHDYTEDFSSAGVELMADFHLFRIPYMISCGVQAAWPKGNTVPVYKFLLNMDLFGLVINRNRM